MRMLTCEGVAVTYLLWTINKYANKGHRKNKGHQWRRGRAINEIPLEELVANKAC